VPTVTLKPVPDIKTIAPVTSKQPTTGDPNNSTLSSSASGTLTVEGTSLSVKNFSLLIVGASLFALAAVLGSLYYCKLKKNPQDASPKGDDIEECAIHSATGGEEMIHYDNPLNKSNGRRSSGLLTKQSMYYTDNPAYRPRDADRSKNSRIEL
jgi:hypothetical protein